jgi:hypothetical protein
VTPIGYDPHMVVEGRGPIKCTGCGEEAAISTKIGVTIACPCGISYTTRGTVVDESGACAEPKWREKRTAEGRAARGT